MHKKDSVLRKLLGSIGVLLCSIFVGFLIFSSNWVTLSAAMFFLFVTFLYLNNFEGFLLLFLVLNENLFYVIPYNTFSYRELMFPMMGIALIGTLLYRVNHKNKTEASKAFLNKYIYFFLCMVCVSIFIPYFYAGQNLILGLRASRWFFLILMYFVIINKHINKKRFLNYVIITGILLCILNNVHYVFWGDINIFSNFRFGERVGEIRFLCGVTFILFSSFCALGLYLKLNHPFYLLSFLYMGLTSIIQGKTRMLIFGLIFTAVILMATTKKFSKELVVFLIFALISYMFIVTAFPNIYAKSKVGKIHALTKREVLSRSGNYGVRIEAYKFYVKEWMESPIFGMGSWNDKFEGNKYFYEKSKYGVHLSDIGFMFVLFQFGLVGFIWLILILKMIFCDKQHILNASPELKGYLIFSIVTAATLNNVLSPFNVVYFSFILGLLANNKWQSDSNLLEDDAQKR